MSHIPVSMFLLSDDIPHNLHSRICFDLHCHQSIICIVFWLTCLLCNEKNRIQDIDNMTFRLDIIIIVMDLPTFFVDSTFLNFSNQRLSHNAHTFFQPAAFVFKGFCVTVFLIIFMHFTYILWNVEELQY